MKKAIEKKRLLGQAWGHAHLKMFEHAVRDCEALVDLDKDDPNSYVELAYYYEKSGHLEKAIDSYRYLMGRFPEFSTAYSNLGFVYQTHKKRFDLAMPLYRKALELNPADTWALNNVGTILQDEGKWGEALSYYEKAFESVKNIDGKRAEQILHNLAWAYYRCKKYEEARKTFLFMLQADNEAASVYSDLGCVYYKMGRFQEALRSFGSALSLFPDSRYYKKLWRAASRKSSVKEKKKKMKKFKIPKGLYKCKKCGEYRGKKLGRGHDASVLCICDGVLCPICKKNKIRRPTSDYYDPSDGKVWHRPWFMMAPCNECQKRIDSRT